MKVTQPIRYVLRGLLTAALVAGTIVILFVVGVILGGDCEPSDMTDDETLCIDFPPGWGNITRFAALGVGIFTWFATRFVTHGLWRPPRQTPEK